jgi:hypothetical protein
VASLTSFLNKKLPYFYVLNIPETWGLGRDKFFFGARDEESNIDKFYTSSTSCKFAINIHEVGQILSFFVLRRVGSFLWWV